MKIALFKGTSVMDKLILFFSRGGYTHAATVLNDNSTIEAKPFSKVHTHKNVIEGLKHNTKIDIFEIETTESQDKIIMDFLTKQMGKKYDYLAIIGFILYATPDGRKKYQKWFCSELVFSAFQQAGINLLERVDAWKVSPTILSFTPTVKLIQTINFKV